MKKYLKKITVGFGILLVVLSIMVVILFFSELKTLYSLKKVDDYPFYTMDYAGDYGFNDFLKIGANSDKDIERFVTKRLLKGIELNLNISSAGCTAFTTKNLSGEVIYGRNFDYDYAPSLLLRTTPKGDYSSISMVNLAYVGYGKGNLPKPKDIGSFLTLAAPYLPFDGINECGVTIALLAVPYAEPPKRSGQVTLNTTTAIRLVLDKAANVNEAINLLKTYNIYFSGDVECHYLIADSSGKSVVVEFMEGEVKIVKPSKDYQIASNFIMYNGLNKGEGFSEFERYDKVEKKLIETNNVLSEKDAMGLLSSVQIPDRVQWSVVYNTSSKSADICINKNYAKVYTYQLNK